MKLLIVSHAYPPVRNARAFRWSALAELWASRGWDVQVVTSVFPGARSNEKLRAVEIHRVGPVLLENVRSLLAPLPSRVNSAPINRESPLSALRSLLRRIFRTIHDATWKQVYWPDSTALWISAAQRKAAEILAVDPHRRVITVSLPFSDHLVGLRLKRHFADTKWIVDIGDPFSIMTESPVNNHRLYSRKNRTAESEVLEQSDAVSVTTAETLKLYAGTFPRVAGKIKVIPPLLIESPRTQGRPNPNTLVFVGTLHRTVRSPSRVLTFFTGLLARSPRPYELHFYGNYAECADMFARLSTDVKRHVHLHGVVDRSEAVTAMQSATALINIGNETDYQLPSKLVEYASIGKPIVNVVGNENDSSVRFLADHPCVFTVAGDRAGEEETAGAALRFLERTLPSNECKPSETWLRHFSLPEISRAYEQLLQ